MVRELKTSWDLKRLMHDEKSCRELLEQKRWNGIPICPHCKRQSEHHYKLKREGYYKCRHCRKMFSVTAGTMFEGSNVPLGKWFYAIDKFLSNKKGVSSLQLSRDIGVTQKTAWFMLNRIRYNLNETESYLYDKFEGIVQVDETYIGGRNKGRYKFNRGRSLKQKIPVVGLLTDDRVYAIVVQNTSGKTLKTLIYGLVAKGSTVVTDEYKSYNRLSNEYIHERVEHGIRNYVNERGFHTNGIEGFWSHLKRGLKGIYHVVRPKHLQLYCDEFAYRYNTRKMTDIQRFLQFLSRPSERLRYSELCYGFI